MRFINGISLFRLFVESSPYLIEKAETLLNTERVINSFPFFPLLAVSLRLTLTLPKNII